MICAAVPAGAVTPRAARGIATASDEASVRRRALETYGRLPMRFEQNVGQTDAQVRFLARGHGYGLFLTDQQAVLTLASHAEAPRARTLVPDATAERRDDGSPTSGDVLRMSFASGRAGTVVAGE